MTAEDVIKEALLDKDYYQKEGGITISGGEPLCQMDFTIDVLKLAKENGINTAIETNLYSQFKKIERILPFTDIVMADLKIFDSDKHKEYTKSDNRLILENLLKLSKTDIPLIVRTPLIQGINDSIDEISDITIFLSTFNNLLYYEFLPYHALGLSKNIKDNKQDRFYPPDKEQLELLTVTAKRNIENIYISNVKSEVKINAQTIAI